MKKTYFNSLKGKKTKFGVGRPQLGQLSASEETSLLQSGQLISGIIYYLMNDKF